jgi:Asp-tRNA(Asn)/Glu-tRNA(Gln) amidotransferase A subunit family amidase
VDALITPATAIPARSVQEVDGTIETYSAHNMLYLRNSSIGNVLNLCGVTVPCGFSSGGMPIGLTLYGKPFDEATVLRVAQAYEQATDWHKRRPALDWAG